MAAILRRTNLSWEKFEFQSPSQKYKLFVWAVLTTGHVICQKTAKKKKPSTGNEQSGGSVFEQLPMAALLMLNLIQVHEF